MTDIPASIVGRIVWGNPLSPQIKKDVDTKQPKLNAQGQQIQQWVFGVAYNKAEFEANIYPAMMAEAALGFPQGTPPKFSWKFVDGDGVDHNGAPFNTREGYAGCYVLTVSTEAFAPPVFKRDAQGNFVNMTPDQIKTGDFVACGLNIKVNVPKIATHTPGLYINPRGIEHVAYGQEIHNGPDPKTMFGGYTYAMPAGASATPLAPAGAGAPQPMQPAPMQPAPMQPAPMQPAPMQPAPMQPAPMQPAPMQPAPMQPAPMQPAPMQPAPMQPAPMQPAPMQPAPMQPAPMQAAPAHDFVQNAGQQPVQQMQPAMQPGQMPPR